MNITTNATHYFPESFRPGRLVLLDLSGNFGGGTVTLGYKAADGAFSAFVKEDGAGVTRTTRGGFQVRVPRSGAIGVTLAASTAASIEFDVIHAVDMPPGS
jgi:hypothetical protein